MTNRLFDDNPYLMAHSTSVTSCNKAEGGYAITSADTIFYPRGGGQPCDGGMINGIEVLDVFADENEEIIHLLPSPLDVGQHIDMSINADVRMAHMAHHLAQHMLSAIFTYKYNNDTVAAHIDHEGGQIEIKEALTPAQLGEAEARANALIKDALAVSCNYFTNEEAAKYDVRGKITPHSKIRLVEIESFDINACGGTHLKNTAELGQIVITGTKSVRGVFRIYFKAAVAAADELNSRTSAILTAQNVLGTSDLSTLAEEAASLIEERTRLENANAHLKQRLLEGEAQRLALKGANINDYLFITDIIPSSEVKLYKAIAEGIAHSQKSVILLSLTSEHNVSLIFIRTKGEKEPNLGAFIKQLADAHNGKGGGSPILAQGMLPYSESVMGEIEKIIENIKNSL